MITLLKILFLPLVSFNNSVYLGTRYLERFGMVNTRFIVSKKKVGTFSKLLTKETGIQAKRKDAAWPNLPGFQWVSL